MSARAPEPAPWRRLSPRVVWVDLVQSILSLLPGAVAVGFLGVEPSLSTLWPLLLVAVVGVTGAAADVVRWAFTRYRVTDTEIERRTGVLVRRRRTVQRDRIRSVDSHARLRHRLAGLRVVTIGAGQQTGAGESAFHLDALSLRDAVGLRHELIDAPGSATAARTARLAPEETSDGAEPSADGTEESSDGAEGATEEVFATFRPWWVVYNMFSIWAYLMAAGLLWGLFWILSTFGVDLAGAVYRAADWESLGWLGVTAVGLLVGGTIGAVGMGVNFLVSHWRFELARVRSGGRSHLRTRRGLLSTREVSRDEARMRGISIGEPLLWRWMGMADTNVITTGLSIWDPGQPTAILPRGPIRVARDVATKVLGEPSPLEAPLRRHPRAALRRRLWWATLVGMAPVAAVAVPVANGAVPPWTLWAVLALWPLALAAAVIAYRSLGHAVVGDHLVVRSGLMSRSTSALRRDAVSTVAVRQSVLQRRLGLCTVSAMTAAGWGAYEAPDVAASDALDLAARAAPGVIDDLLVPGAP